MQARTLAPLIFGSAWGVANPGLGLAAAFVVPLVVAACCGFFNGSLVSHLGTLLAADRSCGLDLKREKGMLAVRTGDRDRAVRRRLRGVPVPGRAALGVGGLPGREPQRRVS